MTFLILIYFLIFFCYTGIILFFTHGVTILKRGKLKDTEISQESGLPCSIPGSGDGKNGSPGGTGLTTSISIIIPIRNESHNIYQLLDELKDQEYPAHLFEIIVTDDFSEDRSTEIVKTFSADFPDLRLRCLEEGHQSCPSTGKKAAIERAVKVASGELIITTDADTRRGPLWLKCIATCYQTIRPQLIISPVAYQNETTLFRKMQSVEFMGIVGITAGSACLGYPIMCNGANLAFRTSAFREINGYAGNQQHASGDDQFLLEKIIQRRGRSAVYFLFDKDAIVYTEAAGTAMDFFQQRLRWVSKSKGYTNPIVIIVGSVTYLTSFGIFLFLIMGFFSPLCWGFMAVAFIGKSLIDFPIVFIMAGFFRKRGLLKYYLFTELFQTGYVVFTGIAGLILPYRWKGRKQFS